MRRRILRASRSAGAAVVMRHSLRDYTRRDIDAALESPHVRDADKAALRAELTRREWQAVADVFERGAACNGCEYYQWWYASGVGFDAECRLLSTTGAQPWQCPQHDNGPNEDEEE
jgi:hypothetical protein